MVVYLNQAVQRYVNDCESEDGTPSFEGLRNAVRDGALLRRRPISMTATAIIVGLLPVMVGSGTGSEVMRRIAAPMVAGSALLLTMLVLPAVYLLWQRRRLAHRSSE